MKKIIIISIIVIVLIICGFFGLNIFYQNAEKTYQQDADILRLEHLEFWTKLVEDYYNKTGYYPFQQSLEKNNSIGLVRIATKEKKETQKIVWKRVIGKAMLTKREAFAVMGFLRKLEK